MSKVRVKDELTPEGRKFEKMLNGLSSLEVRIGFQAGQAAEADGTDICDVATWNELGTSNIPSRPFLRQSVDAHTSEINSLIQSLKAQLTTSGTSAEEILKQIGVFQKGLIQEEISSGSFTPNAPSTVASKGSSRPLIDTGTMRQSVNYVTAQKKALEENNISTFRRYAGSNVTIGGATLAGEWIDVIRFRDWLKVTMQERVFNILRLNRKVPFTDAGIALIEGAMDSTLAEGQEVGGIAPTEYDDDENATPGYTVTVPAASDLTEAERKSRKLTGCKYTARLAGAIHVVEIEGYLTF